MAASAFDQLYAAVGDYDSLNAAYDNLLKNLFANPLWESGAVDRQRVLWSAGRQARLDDMRAFSSPGLYLWGIEERPLYMGITRASFGKRFSRYIWHARSQCNLAQEFEVKLIANDINGFPHEITDWYARHFRGSKVRLRGAVRFAKEGITRVWFTLLPHDRPAEIEEFERALVPVAESWNNHRGLQPLLNVEFNRRKTKARPMSRNSGINPRKL